MPEAAVVAEAIDGFCSADVKPLGPVQAYVAPAIVEAVSSRVCPAHFGPLFPAVGGAGGVQLATVSRKTTPAFPGPPAFVTP